jgi:hypothetical protein
MIPSFSPAGRVAFLTGSSRGRGSAIAHGLAGAGADVILHGRDPVRLDAAIAGMPNCLGGMPSMSLIPRRWPPPFVPLQSWPGRRLFSPPTPPHMSPGMSWWRMAG